MNNAPSLYLNEKRPQVQTQMPAEAQTKNLFIEEPFIRKVKRDTM